MRPSAPRELDFDAILDLVAAHTRTRVGRFLVSELNLSLDRQTILDRCDLTAEMAELVEDGGQLALTGGDDYELCYCLPAGDQAPVSGTRIGWVEAGDGVDCGLEIDIPTGYQHFRH